MSQDSGLPVAVLVATGLVGQHYIDLLACQSWFELVGLPASDHHESIP